MLTLSTVDGKIMAEGNYLEDHIVIVGWSQRVGRIIRELRYAEESSGSESRPLVVIAHPEDTASISDSDAGEMSRVYFIYGDPRLPSVLERACLRSSASMILPAFFRAGTHSDGEGVLVLLNALRVNPRLKVCIEVADATHAEIVKSVSRIDLSGSKVEVVSFESVSERLLAQSAVNHGVIGVFDELLSYEGDTNEFYAVTLHSSWVGATFKELSDACFERGIIAVGIGFASGQVSINPSNRDEIVREGDRLWHIAKDAACGSFLSEPRS